MQDNNNKQLQPDKNTVVQNDTYSIVKLLEETRADSKASEKIIREELRDMRNEQKQALSAIHKTLERMVEVEAKQTYYHEALQSSNSEIKSMKDEIKALETRVDTLEKEAPMTRQVVTWFKKCLWGFAVLGAVLLLNFLGVPLSF